LATSDFSKAGRIIELGPGNGRITNNLLQYMEQETTLYAFEVNPVFCRELKQIEDKRLKVFCESAARLKHFVNGHAKWGITYIVSSIPFGICLKKNATASWKQFTRCQMPQQYSFNIPIQLYNIVVSKNIFRK
jgi:phospholipid N-methyltransferase